MQTLEQPKTVSVTQGIVESEERGLVILSPERGRARRRVIYLDNYGGRAMWEKIKRGEVPPHHLRGCLELVRLGYEVCLAEPLPDFYLRRNGFPHDLKLLRMVRSWLGRDGIVYCGHNVLYWIPLLRRLGLVRCHIVSNLWAREPLNHARAHSGVITLTPVGVEQLRLLAPGIKVANLGWGVDLDFFPELPYNPKWLLHCGIAGRDFHTLSGAAAKSGAPVRVIGSWLPEDVQWPKNVEVIDGGRSFNFQDKRVSFHDLLHTHYAGSAASLIINVADPRKEQAFGCTNVIEAMAMAQPIVLTRSGALPDEIDIEARGCGLFVPPNDVGALAEAMNYLSSNPDRAMAMGRAARKLCESRYNITRFSTELHAFFESL